MDPLFWKNKKVFITGHTGFKGGWMALILQHMGSIVKGYSLEPNTHPSLFYEASIAKNMISEIGDIRNLSSLKASISDFEPEIIFHMAAQPLVRLSYECPVETYETNVMGTVNILEAIRQEECVKACVNITSDKCYKNQEGTQSYTEEDPLGGYDPYSNSKACAELVTDSYRNSYFNPDNYSEHGCSIATVRAGNVIGGGDWAKDRLIPDMFRSFKKQEPVIIRSPDAIRPWQHVLEPLSGYIKLAEKLYSDGPEYAESWNFGPESDGMKPVEWIVETLIKKYGDNASWKLDSHKQKPHETGILMLDSSKSKLKLGWKPVWDLETSLDKIVEWQRRWTLQENILSHTILEIEQYMNH